MLRKIKIEVLRLKFCSECGNPVKEGDGFCGNCGASLALKNRDERINQIRTALIDFANDDTLGRFVIFKSPETNKFVQFGSSDDDSSIIICGVPVTELKCSKEEKDKLKLLLPIVEVGRKGFLSKEKLIQYRKEFQIKKGRIEEINEAAELVDRIFINVFNLPESYEITIEKGTD